MIACLPLIKIWGLPPLAKEKLRSLHREIVAASAAIPELGIREEGDLSVFFPADLMRFRLGADIVIEVGDVDPAARCARPNARLVEALESVLAAWFPAARIHGLFNAEVP